MRGWHQVSRAFNQMGAARFGVYEQSLCMLVLAGGGNMRGRGGVKTKLKTKKGWRKNLLAEVGRVVGCVVFPPPFATVAVLYSGQNCSFTCHIYAGRV
jgi:hypothetical protein